MKLAKVHVTNFRCIEDSNEMTVAPVTCLVGKNESGKTSLLQAIYRLAPWVDGEGTFDRDSDYPRRYLTNFAERHPDEKAPVVTATWTLDQDDRDALAAILGEAGGAITEVTTTKGYGSAESTMSYGVSIDEPAVIAHVLRESGLHQEELEELRDAGQIIILKSRLKALGDKASERHAKLLTTLDANFKRAGSVAAVVDTLHPRLPDFLYFAQYQQMRGQVPLEAIIQRKATNTLNADDRVFLALCDLVGTPVEEMASLTKFEQMNARFESASNRITKEIFRYWTQNRHLRVQIRLDAARPGDPAPFNTGTIVRTRIWNEHHEVSVAFDERSTGFVWFFSFLVLFSQVKKSHADRLIILLDEPGLSLHAKAQADLLRYIDERLAPHHQVIYTTHSPFMVPPDRLLAVRTVEDVVRDDGQGGVEVLGTKVGDDVLSTDADTLFPLQGALGYEITQSLFIGKHTLLVEGPSDLIYLRVLADELRRRGRTSLDRRWTVCPMGGVDKVSAFVSLFGANQLHLAMLIDYAAGQKRKVEDVRRSALLRQGHVLTADAYANMPEADIEDILGAPNYVALVNETYNLTGAQRLAAPSPAGGRITKYVEEVFRSLPASVADYDHYSPAPYLAEHATTCFAAMPDAGGALSRFERLFVDLNALLPKRD